MRSNGQWSLWSLRLGGVGAGGSTGQLRKHRHASGLVKRGTSGGATLARWAELLGLQWGVLHYIEPPLGDRAYRPLPTMGAWTGTRLGA